MCVVSRMSDSKSEVCMGFTGGCEWLVLVATSSLGQDEKLFNDLQYQ